MKTIGVITDWHENKQKFVLNHEKLRTEAITDRLTNDT